LSSRCLERTPAARNCPTGRRSAQSSIVEASVSGYGHLASWDGSVRGGVVLSSRCPPGPRSWRAHRNGKRGRLLRDHSMKILRPQIQWLMHAQPYIGKGEAMIHESEQLMFPAIPSSVSVRLVKKLSSRNPKCCAVFVIAILLLGGCGTASNVPAPPTVAPGAPSPTAVSPTTVTPEQFVSIVSSQVIATLSVEQVVSPSTNQVISATPVNGTATWNITFAIQTLVPYVDTGNSRVYTNVFVFDASNTPMSQITSSSSNNYTELINSDLNQPYSYSGTLSQTLPCPSTSQTYQFAAVWYDPSSNQVMSMADDHNTSVVVDLQCSSGISTATATATVP
jgi:hypothetical protein